MMGQTFAERRGIDLDAVVARRGHGTHVTYVAGCRCLACRAAHSRYESERLRARRSGDWNGLVDARAARVHLAKLSRRGVGRRAVADAAGVPPSTLRAIRVGEKTKIRKRTEARILAVDAGARSGGSLVPAGPTWRRIERLLAEGFTKTELARRLGSTAKTPSLQIRKDFVTARTAADVERLYNRVMR